MIDETGQQLGIMPPPQALTIARSKGLDLVEISPTAVPPVCRIMDYGKYQYQEAKRSREAKKHQKVIEVKEIKFRPKVDEHDYQFKKKHIERFLEEGDKVKATIFFRGREMAHPEIGRRMEQIDSSVGSTRRRSHRQRFHRPAGFIERRQPKRLVWRCQWAYLSNGHQRGGRSKPKSGRHRDVKERPGIARTP